MSPIADPTMAKQSDSRTDKFSGTAPNKDASATNNPGGTAPNNATNNKNGSATNKSARKRGILEAFDMVKAYASQELLAPLAKIRRWFAMGVLGSFGIIVGLVLLTLASLRALQEETGGRFEGNLSWVPYVIVLVALIVLLSLLRLLINKRRL